MELSTLNQTTEIIERIMRHEDHLSYSSLKAFSESPADFIRYKMGAKETTPAMAFGSMLHCLILEPEEFDSRYFLIEDEDICKEIGGAKPRSTNKYKDWLSTQADKAGDREMIQLGDFKEAEMIASNVRYNNPSKKIIDQCNEKEMPIEWEFKNFRFKGFMDGNGDKVIVDIKSCSDASPKKFQRDIISNKYHLQAAMYSYAVGGKDYYIIAVDRKGGVSVHLLSKELIGYGMEEYNYLMDKFNECVLFDLWDSSFDFYCPSPGGIYTAEKPAYL